MSGHPLTPRWFFIIRNCPLLEVDTAKIDKLYILLSTLICQCLLQPAKVRNNVFFIYERWHEIISAKSFNRCLAYHNFSSNYKKPRLDIPNRKVNFLMIWYLKCFENRTWVFKIFTSWNFLDLLIGSDRAIKYLCNYF